MFKEFKNRRKLFKIESNREYNDGDKDSNRVIKVSEEEEELQILQILNKTKDLTFTFNLKDMFI